MCAEGCTLTAQEDDEDRPARRLGRKLREARIAAGYSSQELFSTDLSIDRTAISRIENGNRHINTDLLRKWCEACHVDFELYEASARLALVADASPVPVWFESFFHAQVLAHTIRTWHTSFIPGLLQTSDHARALIEGAGTPDGLVDERVSTRMDLQQRTIERQPVPVQLIAVMEEAALHRQVGTAEVRYRQLMHLVEQGQRKHIRIQIVPASRGANAGNVGAFTIASLDDADVMLMDAVEDVTTDKRTAIREALSIFDRVRWAALSGPESLELIMKVAETCKP